jgi:glutathione synthase/RimK-type ligase-like ATP-grasp enzyme
MISFSLLAFTHTICVCLKRKKMLRPKKYKNRVQIGSSATQKKIETSKKYFRYYNSQSASAAVLSFKLPTTTTYYSYYFTREIEHKSEVLSTATANIKNFARNNTTMVESEDIKHSHLAFF